MTVIIWIHLQPSSFPCCSHLLRADLQLHSPFLNSSLGGGNPASMTGTLHRLCQPLMFSALICSHDETPFLFAGKKFFTVCDGRCWQASSLNLFVRRASRNVRLPFPHPITATWAYCAAVMMYTFQSLPRSLPDSLSSVFVLKVLRNVDLSFQDCFRMYSCRRYFGMQSCPAEKYS